MKPTLTNVSLWFESLSERERRIVLTGAVLAAAILIFGVIVPLDRSVSSARTRVEKKQTDLQWMRRAAPEIAAAGPPPSVAGGSLLAVVDRSARESGLGGSLAGSDPSGPGGLQVRLEKAPFDILVGWLARLSQQNGIRVEAATIDGAGAPGLVNAAIVLRAG